MPKLKTKRGAAKRFKVTKNGKIIRHRAYHSHLLRKKDPKRKRRLRKFTLVAPSNRKAIKALIPYKF